MSSTDAAARGSTVPRRTGYGRDTALDNGVIAHEYGHGLSNRLVGGPANVGCLWNAEQMGEGWSDFLGMLVTATGAGPEHEYRTIGTWLMMRPNTGAGVRGLPYSTDMTANKWVYDDIKQSSQAHFVGMRWNAALWEVYWELVRAHGFSADLTYDWKAAGNTLALRLLVDSLKLTLCSPGFVDGRDAMLLADRNLTGGANQCRIRRGFAKRGLGVRASQVSSDSTTDGTQAFGVAASCVTVADDGASTDLDTPLEVGAPGVLGNDTGLSADTHQAELVAGPERGHVTLRDDGGYTYTPRDSACRGRMMPRQRAVTSRRTSRILIGSPSQTKRALAVSLARRRAGRRPGQPPVGWEVPGPSPARRRRNASNDHQGAPDPLARRQHDLQAGRSRRGGRPASRGLG